MLAAHCEQFPCFRFVPHNIVSALDGGEVPLGNLALQN